MKNVARQYFCALCCKKVTICSACDKGNIYCNQKCSQLARNASKRAADRKYQNNQRGKLKHAERQRRYRLRIKKIVTDHTLKPLPSNDLLSPTLNKVDSNTENSAVTHDRCHFCKMAIKVWIFHEPDH